MEINKDTWHYKAWAWSHRNWAGGVVPEQSNLCTYVRELVIRVPLIVLALAFLIVLMSVFLVIPLNIVALPFGRYIRHPIIEEIGHEERSIMGRYQGLKIGGFVLLPWHVLAPVLTALLVWWDCRVIARHDFGHPVLLIQAACLLVAILLGVPFLYSESQAGKLAREYVDAKTKGICPLITFKDDK